MLSGTSLDEYRFRRTGFTNVFVFDCYIQIIVITVTYLMLLGVTLLSRRSGKFKKVRPMLETMLTVFHEIALMYFTLTILFEFSYFDVSKPVRIASLAICILITIYYLGYHVYRFYDLMNYSYAELGST
jgi:L-asparagine transporter-like permease